jgi:streptogramin lyase
MGSLLSLRRALTACLLTRLRDTGLSLKPFASFTLLALLGMAPSVAHASNTIKFTDATQTLVGNLSSISGIATDAQGDIYVAEIAEPFILEIVAVNGVIPANPTINHIGSGFSDPGQLAVDASGNVFIADSGNNAVKEILAVNGSIPANPTINTLGSGFLNPTAVAVDAAGNVFVCDSDHSEIKEILAVSGSIPANSPTINTLGGGFYFPNAIAIDASDNVFVADHSAVKEILASGGYTTVNTLGSGFDLPYGVAVDGSGDVFVTDNGNEELSEILAVNGSVPSSNPTVIVLKSTSIETPVTVDATGDALLGDSGNVDKIMLQAANFGSAAIATTTPVTLPLIFTFSGGDTISYSGANHIYTQGAAGLDFAVGSSTCLPGFPYSSGSSCTLNVTFTPTASGPRYGAAVLTDSFGNALATAPLFGIGTGPQVTFSPGTESPIGIGTVNQPYVVAVDAKANVYVGDDVTGNVSEFTAASGYSTGLTLATFSYPSGLVVDGSGNVFVCDSITNQVYEIIAVNGSIPNNPTVNTIVDGLDYPNDMAMDQFGNIFLTNAENQTVEELFAASGYTVNRVLGSGFNDPYGIAVDTNGNVFVADIGNATVEEIVAVNGAIPANPTINTIGSGFSYPAGVTVDGNGNVYVVDAGTLVLQKILPAGGYTTVQTLATGFGAPVSLALDSKGDIFVADQGAQVVQELNYSTPPSLTFPSTAVGSTTTPQTVTVTNYGNAPLSLVPPASGLNPAISTGFTLDSSSTCPQIGPSSISQSLPASASCTLAVDFAPTTAGSVSGSLIVTDNALNTVAPNYSTQTITLSGTATGGTAPPPTKITPTIKVTSSANPSTVGSAITLAAKLTATSGTPTGTAEFKDGSTDLGNVAIVNGTASYTTSALTVGTHSITVVYNGDSNFNTVTSAALSQVVNSATTGGGTTTTSPTGISLAFGSSTSSQSVASNSTATYTVNIAPVGSTTFTDSVTYTLSGMPSGWVATFNPTSIAAGSTSQAVTLTLYNSSVASMFRVSSVYPVALGLLLLPFTGRVRRISKRWSQLACLLLLVAGGAAIVTATTGCGGGSSTPAATSYTMTLKATSGSLSQSTTLNLTVK